MTAGGETSWYDFAKDILEEAATIPKLPSWFAAATSNLPLITRQVIPIPTSEYPTPARRPAYSVLSNTRLNGTFSVKLPDWRKQLHSVFVVSPPETP
jgi:dTDP-4-dehydrorhamnose reductase